MTFLNDSFFRVKLAHTFFSCFATIQNIFVFIFLYSFYDGSLFEPLLVYATINILYSFILYRDSYIIGRIGANKSAIVGILTFLFAFTQIYLFELYGDTRYLFIYLILVPIGMFFYKISYNIQLVDTIMKSNVGEKIGDNIFFNGIVVTCVLGGSSILFHYYGTLSLLITSLVVSIPAMLLYWWMPSCNFHKDIEIQNILEERRINKRIVEAGVLSSLRVPFVFIWTVWIFLVVERQFIILGILLVSISILSFLLAKLFGRYLDEHNKREELINIEILEGVNFFIKYLSFIFPFLIVSDIISRIVENLHTTAYRSYIIDCVENGKEDYIDEHLILEQVIFGFVSGLMFLCASLLFLIEFQINFIFLILGVFYTLAFIFAKKFHKGFGKLPD